MMDRQSDRTPKDQEQHKNGRSFSTFVQNLYKSVVKEKKSGTWRTMMMIIAAVIIFITTYGLILPAITLEEKKAQETPGIHLESDVKREEEERTSGEVNTNRDDESNLTDYGEEDEKKRAVPGDGIDQDSEKNHESTSEKSTSEKSTEGKPEIKSENNRDTGADNNHEDSEKTDREKDTEKNRETDDVNKDKSNDADRDAPEYITEPLVRMTHKYVITVSFGEEACIPAGTGFDIKIIGKDSPDYKYYEEALRAKSRKLTGQTYYKFELTKDGQEIRPQSPVNIRFESRDDKQKTIECGALFYEESTGLQVKFLKDESVRAADEVQKELVFSDIPFYKEGYLPVIGLAVKDDSEEKQEEEKDTGVPADAQTDQSVDESTVDTAAEYPAAEFKASTDNLDIYVKADKGALPAGTVMRVHEVTEKKALDAITETVEKDDSADQEKREVQEIHAADITFTDKEGKEIEPLKSLRVAMTSKLVGQADEKDDQAIAAVHLDDAGTGTLMDIKEEENKDKISFDAESFSVYAVVSYTVDFHYEVNGKVYEFSIPGGGFASFYKIVEVLGISNQGTQSGSEGENEAEKSEIEAGNGENTDGNAVYNVVEEAGVEDTGTYSDAISLNSVEVSEATREFVADVASVEFSSPELVWVGKVDEETTVGGLKEANGLEVQYSAELTEEQISEINGSTVESGDWALISVRPFTSEESLTVTMKNGDQFAVRVTDYQNVNNTDYFNNDYTFVIWTTGNDGRSYALKSDGTTAEINTTDYNDPDYVDRLGAEYQWKITYGFNSGVDRYFIRPVTDLTKNLYLAGNGNYVAPGGSLIQNEDCGIRIYHTDSDNTWKLEGWNWISLNLGYNTHLFEGNNDYYSQINLSRQQGLPEYEFTVRTEDIRRGFANGQDKDGIAQSSVREYDTKTNFVQDGPKTNLYPITAVPATDDHGNQKYLFDYWDLDGERLSLGETIGVDELTIPRNKSVLTAHFKKNPDYVVPDEEKDGHSIDKQAMDDWLAWLKDPDRVTPFEVGDCGKTAEVYDYENRIYRVDITAKSNIPSFVGDIDLGFMLDVSSSMKFPAKLDPVEGLEEVDINHINDNSTNQALLNQGTTYYLISDKGSTATVYEIRWGTWVYNSLGQTRTGWGYKDASKDDSNMKYIVNSSAWSGGEVGEIYPIYVDGDPGHTRSYYLENSITNTINELNEILAALSVAANTGQEPKVKVAWNTFHKWVRDPHHDFTSVEGLSISPTYSYSGGTSADLAMLDAAGIQRNDPSGADAEGRLYNWHSGITYSSTDGFHWEDNAAKYAVLITDGAPQRNGNDVDAKLVTDAADFLKNGADGIAGTDDDIKLITVGLSMGDVKKGSVRLYDISSLDEEGDPLFYKAITGDELQYALYQMLQHTMGTALVQSDISDTINEAFYPVDKITGAPLNPGNVINLDGEKIGDSVGNLTDEQKKAGYGTIGWDNTKGLYTVQWTDQNVSGDGWHGAVYEKAKEDFIGGNTVRTNDGEAVIQAKSYKPNADADPIALKDAIVNGAGRIPLETPRVNVNELDFLKNDTQWTVYLGTELKEADLKEQLQKLYENIEIVQVVTKDHGTDTDGDGFIDKVNGNKDTAYYFTMQESALDKLDPKPGAIPEIMYLKDVIKKLNGGNDLTTEQWNTLITLSDEEGDANTGIEFPYAVYGQDCPGTIILKLTKDHALEDHVTDTIGSPVETYTLFAEFSPMYLHIPAGQSGTDPWEYHTGGFGLSTCGLAAGKDDCTSTHVINVFAKKLQIEKVDQSENTIKNSPAVFKLYREALEGEEDQILDSEDVPSVLPAGKNYILKDTFTTNSDGIAVTNVDIDKLPDNAPYYLIETKAPDGYIRLNGAFEVRAMTDAETGTGTVPQDVWTKVPVSTPSETSNIKWNPYVLSDWQQNATIIVEGDGGLSGFAIREGNITYDHNQEEDMVKVSYKIRNNAGVALPNTGGPGTNILYLFGIMLTGLAGAGLVMKRRRKEVA